MWCDVIHCECDVLYRVYVWHHMHYIWHVIYCVWYPIQYMCDITHACISDITQSMFMTYPLYMASHIVLWKHNHCVTSQPLCLTPTDQFYQTQCMDDITASNSMTSYALYVTSHHHFRTSHDFIYASSPLYLTSRPVYTCHHTQTISDITDNIYMPSHPV